MIVVGIDSCRYGWLAIYLTLDGKWEVKVASNIDDLLLEHAEAALYLIDIPLGLIEAGKKERQCDTAARKILKRPRGASVFVIPCRSSIYQKTYDSASALNYQKTGRKLSIFSWHISKKIKEIDQLLRTRKDLQPLFHEAHPELCFWSFQQKAMRYSKKTKAGSTERLLLLTDFFAKTPLIYQNVSEKFPRKKVALDDILDALVLALTGLSGWCNGFNYLPDEPEFDNLGLKMQLIYAKKMIKL